MIPDLIERADDIECIITASPHEALILERQLIREHKPRYNSRLKDDKSYPYLALSTDELPRILYTRPPKDADIWGPFLIWCGKTSDEIIEREFGLRDDKNNIPFGYVDSGSDDDYRQRIIAVKQILNGNASKLIEDLTEKMDSHSEKLEYEIAARNRD